MALIRPAAAGLLAIPIGMVVVINLILPPHMYHANEASMRAIQAALFVHGIAFDTHAGTPKSSKAGQGHGRLIDVSRTDAAVAVKWRTAR